MFKLEWDKTGEHYYEAGCDRGVHYPVADDGTYPAGYAWNGLTKVSENPSGGDTTDLYANNSKYLSLRAVENFGANVEAYTYPESFAECDGSAEVYDGVFVGQQPRKAFGMSYRTLIGNDTQGENCGYKVHMIWNATVSPSQRDYETMNENPDASPFSWEMDTTPVAIGEINGKQYKPAAHIYVDSRSVTKEKLSALEEILYGNETTEPRLPSPKEVLAMFA